jgi:uncharacterized protein
MGEELQDAALLAAIVRSFVFHPEDVRVERTVDERGVLLTLFVNQEDIRYVIGREGRVATALRIILKMVGARQQANVSVHVFETDEARQNHFRKRSSQLEQLNLT